MRRIVFASWDDCGHLTEAQKAAQLADMDPHLRDARTRGIPFLGSGAVFPVSTEVIEIRPFEIPKHWPRGFGLDVGWNRTAALWGALDQSSDILYLYDEHYVAEENPSTHANAILGYGVKGTNRGRWIPGVCDPAARGRSQRDGERLIDDYHELGLNLEAAASRTTDSAVHEVWLRLSSGRLKVFSTLQYFFKEYLLYRRDKNGRIIENKQRPDHLIDCLKFLVVSGIARMVPPPYEKEPETEWDDPYAMSGQGWMSS